MYPKISVMVMKNDYAEMSPTHNINGEATTLITHTPDPGVRRGSGGNSRTGRCCGSVGGPMPCCGGGSGGGSCCAVQSWFQQWSVLKIIGAAMVVFLVGIIAFDETIGPARWRHVEGSPGAVIDGTVATFQYVATEGKIPMPGGVNIGSWLSLEDYFFAGHESVEVATPFGRRVAACLPPLHVGAQTGPKWSSETDLMGNLSLMLGPGDHGGDGMAHAVQVFQAHRTSFVDLDVDLARLAALGVKSIRVPMSWCLTDHDPRAVDLKAMDGAEVAAKFTCEDPFFGKEVLWPAVPKALVVDLLRACGQHGLHAALDVHTYPGGTSIGTFSGVWPRWPKFWTDGDVQSTDYGMSNPGHVLFSELVAWMESLAETDPLAFAGLRALSPMNEPAHLAGLFGGSHPTDQNFLPPLPKSLAAAYLEELSTLAYSPSSSTPIPDGTHLRVLFWFQQAIEIFRNSKLPSMGKQLHANIHESILNSEYLPTGDADWGGRHPEATAIVSSWWCSASTTRPEERSDWAILDMHHYHAWEEPCMGSVTGQGARYACGDVEARDETLDRCTQWAPTFREIVDRECGPGAKLMSAEFSAASHHSVRHACNDVGTLKESYIRQVEAANAADVELFYWSYHMPYGGAFRRAWSFQLLMYLLGVLDRPDEPQFECNEHVADEEEPNDDFFAFVEDGPSP